MGIRLRVGHGVEDKLRIEGGVKADFLVLEKRSEFRRDLRERKWREAARPS